MAGIYLHIPFCKTRCIYCDFFSTTKSEKKEQYIEALCKELIIRKPYLEDETIETIYFGGGTPSQLDKADFEQIFKTIDRVYGMDHCKEITLEANPDDLSLSYIVMLASLPFNRISIGIQTFDESTLKLLKRRHSAQQALDAIKNCRTAGFENISIDLMYGLPGETLQQWTADLQQAIDLNVEHISAYHLIYEKGTALYNMRTAHQVEEVDEECSVNFFETMINQLTKAGFQHYEISNFCKPEKHSKHNSSYWTGQKYLGCGPSAHSYNGTNRQWNIALLEEYIEGINTQKPNIELETLDKNTRYNDFVITSLRTMWGLSLTRLKEEFGETYYKYCLLNSQPHINANKLKIKNNTLLLTKEGIFISDGVMSDLLWVED